MASSPSAAISSVTGGRCWGSTSQNSGISPTSQHRLHWEHCPQSPILPRCWGKASPSVGLVPTPRSKGVSQNPYPAGTWDFRRDAAALPFLSPQKALSSQAPVQLQPAGPKVRPWWLPPFSTHWAANKNPPLLEEGSSVTPAAPSRHTFTISHFIFLGCNLSAFKHVITQCPTPPLHASHFPGVGARPSCGSARGCTHCAGEGRVPSGLPPGWAGPPQLALSVMPALWVR